MQPEIPAAILLCSPLSFQPEKKGEGSSSGSSHAPTLVIDPEGRYMGFMLLWKWQLPIKRLANLAVEFKVLDLGSCYKCLIVLELLPGEQQAIYPAWLRGFCLLGADNSLLLRFESLILSAKAACNGKPAYFIFMVWADRQTFGSASRVGTRIRGLIHLLQQAASELLG